MSGTIPGTYTIVDFESKKLKATDANTWNVFAKTYHKCNCTPMRVYHETVLSQLYDSTTVAAILAINWSSLVPGTIVTLEVVTTFAPTQMYGNIVGAITVALITDVHGKKFYDIRFTPTTPYNPAPSAMPAPEKHKCNDRCNCHGKYGKNHHH